MKSITTLENIPDSLDIQEMMDVKGGAEARAICIFSVAVKCNVVGSGTCTVAGSGTCTVAGSGTVVAPKPNPTAPAEPRR